MKMKTGERIKLTRKEKHISAEELAAAANISPATIYRYENGDISEVPADKVEAIASALNTTVPYLTGKLKRDLHALDIEIRNLGHAGVELIDAGSGASVRYSKSQWLRLQERVGLRTIWHDLYRATRKTTTVNDDGLSEEKRKLIDAVKSMSDADARKLRIIAEQVLLG